jgi:hypothetical protein
VAARGPHDDSDRSDRHATDTVPDDRPTRAESPLHLGLELLHDAQGGSRVGLVEEGRHGPRFGRVRPDASGEDHHPADGRIVQFPEGSGGNERSPAQADRHG